MALHLGFLDLYLHAGFWRNWCKISWLTRQLISGRVFTHRTRKIRLRMVLDGTEYGLCWLSSSCSYNARQTRYPDRPIRGWVLSYLKERYIVCSCIIPQTLFYRETYPLTSDIGLDTKWRKPTFGRSWGPLWLPPLLTSFNAAPRTPSSTLAYFSAITLRETSNYPRYVIFHKTHNVFLYQTMQGFTEREMLSFLVNCRHWLPMMSW